MSRDTPRAEEREPPPDAPDADEGVVDVLALEDEVLAAESEAGIEPDDEWSLEDEDPLERAGRLNRLVQHGALARGFLESNEIPPGHSIDKHVGKSDDWLHTRLEAEERRATSTFTDLETAELAVAKVLRERSKQIDEWLEATVNRRLAVDMDSGDVVGRVVTPEAPAQPSSKVVVVLLRSPSGYQIMTAYPGVMSRDRDS